MSTTKTRPTAPPTLARLTAGELEVCDRVQRTIESAHARKLARNWDDSLVGVLTVSYRDGHFYVVDGQQRLYVQNHLKENPGYEFSVNVWEHLTEEDEGRLFLAINRDHKAVSTFDRFRVAANIGQPDELAVLEIVAGEGFTVGGKSSTNVIGCPATLLRIYRQTGAENLRQAIQVHRAVFEYDTDPWNAVVFEGVALFLYRHHDKINAKTLVQKLSRHGSAYYDREARARAVGNNRAVGAMVRVIEEAYDWKTRKPLFRAPEDTM